MTQRRWSFLVSLGFSLLLPCAASAADAQTCLDDATPVAQRRNIVHKGVEMPVGVFHLNWASAGLSNTLIKILIGDVLGYHAIFSGTGDGSEMALYAVSGCNAPTDFVEDAQCGVDQITESHLAIEVWDTDKSDNVRDVLATVGNSDMMAVKEGDIGYEGYEGQAVFREIIDAAWQAEGLALEYYRSYDATWHEPWVYFDRTSAISTTLLKKCEETRLYGRGEIQNYLAVTGDVDGTQTLDNGDVVGRCWNGSWWLSPQCRSNPDRCIPSITASTGWGIEMLMQRAAVLKFPVAIAIAKLTTDWAAIPLATKGLPYYYGPDTTFIAREPVLMIPPPFDQEAQDAGSLVSSAENTKLGKWVSPTLQLDAGPVYELVKRMTLSEKSINEILLAKAQNATAADFDTSCRWLRANEDKWKTWIPRQTECALGQGLVDAEGNFVASRAEAKSCEWCGQGKFSEPMEDVDGPTAVCQECEAGKAQSNPGQAQCDACVLGTFAATTGKRECDRCMQGTYQDQTAKTACIGCPAGMTTPFLSARNKTDCVCPAGTYGQGKDFYTCKPCPDGMTCSEMNSTVAAIDAYGDAADAVYPFPQAAPGFMTLSSEPLRPYACKPLTNCPGGPPGTCARNRDTTNIACGKCLPDYHTGQDGGCHSCSDGVAPFFLTAFAVSLVVILIVLVRVVNNANQLQQANSTTRCLIMIGLTFTTVQAMGVFGSLSVEWVQPLSSIFDVLSVLSFDPEVLKTECTLGNHPVTNYIMRQCVTPVCLGLVGLMIWIRKRFFDPDIKFLLQYVNTCGTVMQTFFISVVVSCCLPFVCFQHPGDRGASMIADPSVLCFQDDTHAGLIAVGITSFSLIVLPYWAVIAYGTFMYPKFIMDGNANQGEGLQMFRFLFVRFTTQSYFYGLAVMTRNLFICLIPVVIRDAPARQLLALSTVIQGFALWQLMRQPWLSWICNWMDGALASLLVLLLVCCAISTDFVDVSGTVGVLATLLFVALSFSIVACISWAVYRRIWPTPYYHRFICHHKQDAAAQARLLQMLLMQVTAERVFLDSDNLTNLNELFDVVRTSVGQVLVFLTSDTLRRPWCAGEITVTFKTHQRLALLRTTSFVRPTPAEIQDPMRYLDTSSLNLTELGITMDLVSQAFTWLLLEDGTIPVYELDPRPIGRVKFNTVVNSIFAGGSALRGAAQRAVVTSVALKRGMSLQPLDDNKCEELPFRKLSSAIRVSSNSASTPASPKRSSSPSRRRSSSEGPASGMMVISSELGNDEACAAAGILVHKVQVRLLGMSDTLICVLCDAPDMDDEEVEATVSKAHTVAVLLSSGTLECTQQIQVIITAMATANAVDSNRDTYEVIPVNTPSFRFPTENFYCNHLPDLFPDYHAEARLAVESFFKRIAVTLATHSSDTVLEAQASEFLARVPRGRRVSDRGPLNGLVRMSGLRSI